MKKGWKLLAAAAAAAAAAGGTVYMDTHRFRIRRYTVSSEKIRKNTRIVLLADLHDQVYGRHNERLLRAVDRVHPDIVISAGDLITAHHDPKAQQGEESTALLMTLARRYPMIAINGNHETRIDERRNTYGDRYDDYEAMVHSAGGILLRNEHVLLADRGIMVTGLELPTKFFGHFLKKRLGKKKLKKKIGCCDGQYYNILIAHHPDYFPKYRKWGADLVLSGHIHGGVVRLPFVGGVISPTGRIFPKYDGGRFQEKGSTMILSRGLGMHTIHFRLFNPGELVVIDCHAGGAQDNGT